jgi:regulatory protein
VNTRFKPRRAAPPLNQSGLRELALRYVGKYATSRAKLRDYLGRKVRERGWDDTSEPDFTGLANRFAELGYIDDASYAMAKSRALGARGYGKRRLTDQLRMAGIEEADSEAATDHAAKEAVATAVRFAQRRRLGPFAAAASDPKGREKAIAAMVRAGHAYAIARAIADMLPGANIDIDQLGERFHSDCA